MAAISLHALRGQRNPSTIRMSGRLQGQEVEVLIDGSFTHNFIQERVAIHLGLPIVAFINFTVIIGNGDHMCCSGVCANASLQLDGHEFPVDLFVLPIHGADLVLGGKSLTLQGRQPQRIAPIQFHRLERLFNMNSSDESFLCFDISVIQTPEQHNYLIKLLGFDFIVTYKPRKDNAAADALSRQHEETEEPKVLALTGGVLWCHLETTYGGSY
ncbi:hypothetical protein Pint_31374 [Pistacia integerrima]|uniref:Uncharacterized protein n=1 Tax=Pistacia integerrima TaxID=434235 RepID=A0ACC0XRJ2_9ROSI|nr:hypothetical protein Pint_31374 [Pistacia integerrima]